MSTQQKKRRPKGIREGGRFAATDKPDDPEVENLGVVPSAEGSALGTTERQQDTFRLVTGDGTGVAPVTVRFDSPADVGEWSVLDDIRMLSEPKEMFEDIDEGCRNLRSALRDAQRRLWSGRAVYGDRPGDDQLEGACAIMRADLDEGLQRRQFVCGALLKASPAHFSMLHDAEWEEGSAWLESSSLMSVARTFIQQTHNSTGGDYFSQRCDRSECVMEWTRYLEDFEHALATLDWPEAERLWQVLAPFRSDHDYPAKPITPPPSPDPSESEQGHKAAVPDSEFRHGSPMQNLYASMSSHLQEAAREMGGSLDLPLNG